jgi:hypothetical protein
MLPSAYYSTAVECHKARVVHERRGVQSFPIVGTLLGGVTAFLANTGRSGAKLRRPRRSRYPRLPRRGRTARMTAICTPSCKNVSRHVPSRTADDIPFVAAIVLA